MGRPPLPLGTYGRVLFIAQAGGRVQARARFRDYDGCIRLVSKIGGSRPAAERALKADLTRRQAPGGQGAISPATRLDALADAWLLAPHAWASGTQRTYATIVRNQVKPALGRLRLQEVSPGAVSRALTAMTARSGPSAAKSARACLSGMFALAVEDGAVSVNPVRDASARIRVARRPPRALTREEALRLGRLLGASARALELDLPDLVTWMLATGCRIGEALALRYGTNGEGRPLLDVDARTWEVNATVVRVPGQGLRIQPRTKTAAGWRVIAIPDHAVAMLKQRQSLPHRRKIDGLVFAAPAAGTLRDPNNVSGDLRGLLDAFECEVCTSAQERAGGQRQQGRPDRCQEGPWSWVTSHTFRKTVATRLDEAGFTPRQVADQLGHANPSMTLDVYFGRHVVSASAAQALNV